MASADGRGEGGVHVRWLGRCTTVLYIQGGLLRASFWLSGAALGFCFFVAFSLASLFPGRFSSGLARWVATGGGGPAVPRCAWSLEGHTTQAQAQARARQGSGLR